MFGYQDLTIKGIADLHVAVAILIRRSTRFRVDPLPHDFWSVSVRTDAFEAVKHLETPLGLPEWTVCGTIADSGPFVEHVQAEDADTALDKVAGERKEFSPVAVFEGRLCSQET